MPSDDSPPLAPGSRIRVDMEGAYIVVTEPNRIREEPVVIRDPSIIAAVAEVEWRMVADVYEERLYSDVNQRRCYEGDDDDEHYMEEAFRNAVVWREWGTQR